MGVPVKKSVHIGQHKQPIIYEGSDIFCNSCGVLGHNAINYVVPQTNQQNMQAMEIRQGDNARGSDVQTSTPYMADPEEKWQTVTFNRQKKQNKRTPKKINNEPGNFYLNLETLWCSINTGKKIKWQIPWLKRSLD
ncbi:uncharacterized protein LOC125875863 [Solanum stenotomum]|uniref:uncharacterized protein LOC125875863 n=1 Tax=Solanum stenotomum TaxID=172797 RepID=UPI0020D05299|nr:uncharacterized protein LOC125875863 [Solanum stenotomum]